MKKVIATVGPSLLHNTKLTEVHNESYIYRINGAHGSIADLEAYILEIRKQVPQANIMIDLPGNKVRTANLETPIKLEYDKSFTLFSNQTNYPEFYTHLKEGDIVWANDSTFQFVVQNIQEGKIEFLSKSEGILLKNKGLHVRGIHASIPFLFDKDKLLIELANKHLLSHVGLSFVRHVTDIRTARQLIDSRIEVVSKVETKAAVDNLTSILQEVEYILVDRGDLSTEIGLEKIPAYQKFIIEKALFHNKKVFLATQFLKNMEEKPTPTIAEVIDMYHTFKMGVYGIQLSEETAVGKYPKECLMVIQNLIDEITKEVTS